MGEHHALRERRRTGGVLDEGDRFAAELGVGPRFGVAGSDRLTGQQPRGSSQVRGDRPQLLPKGGEQFVGENADRLGILGDRPQTRNAPLGVHHIGQKGRNGDQPAVHAGDERNDEFGPGRHQDDDPVAGASLLLKAHRQGASLTVEFAVAERKLVSLAVEQESEDGFVTLRIGAATHHVNEINKHTLYILQQICSA